ncbi:MAG: hypothetical protein ABI640_05010 [Gammaproteobacteria bacterium]
MSQFSIVCRVAISVLALAIVAPIEAQDATNPPAQFALKFGVGHTDNVAFDSTEIAAPIVTVGTIFDVVRNSPRIAAYLVGDVDYRHYDTNAVIDADEIVGSVDGNVTFQLVPRLFEWMVQENFGQTRTNPLRTASVGNRERTAIFSTGPRLNVPIGSRNILKIGLSRAERRFEDSTQYNGEVDSTNVAWVHAVSAMAAVQVVVDDSEMDFRSNSPGYEFRTVSAGYIARLPSGSIELRGGRGEIVIASKSDPTTVGRLVWNRTLGARSSMSLWAARELTDTGETFRLDSQPAATVGSPETIFGDAVSTRERLADVFGANGRRLRDARPSRDPFKRSSVGVRFELVGLHSTLAFTGESARDRYESSDVLNNDTTSTGITFDREFGTRWRGDLGLTFVKEDYLAGNNDGDDIFSRLIFSRGIGRLSTLSFGLEKNQQRRQLDFDETVYTVSLRHSILQ